MDWPGCSRQRADHRASPRPVRRAGKSPPTWRSSGAAWAAAPRHSSALRAGRTVVLTEATDWIGGQLTSQAVPPDEHPWVEKFGVNASYQDLRRGIRDVLPPPLPDDRPCARSPSAQPRQRRRVEALSRAAGRARGSDGHARPVCLQRPAALPARARAGEGRRAGRPRARRDRPRRPDRSGAIPDRSLFPRRDRAGRPAADGRRRVRHRGRVAGPHRRAARRQLGPARQPAGDHLLLRRRVPRGRGPHHRSTRRIRRSGATSSPS